MQPAYPLPPAPLRLASAESVFQNAREYFDKGELPLFGSVFADEQKAGHGQYNRAWESRRGNVHAAIRLPLAGVWQTAASAAALAALIADELEKLGYAVLIKWPNDIVALTHKGAAKAGGILLKEIGGLLTAGIGLNLSWAPGADVLREGAALPAGKLADAVPLHQNAPGTPYSRLSDPYLLWCRIAARIAREDPLELLERWRALAEDYLLWKGENISVLDPEGPGSGRLEGRLFGLSTEGELVIQSHARMISYLRGSLTRN